MKLHSTWLVLLTLLAACSSPSGGGSNGGSGGGGSTVHTYGFAANYACVSNNSGGPETNAYGFISAVEDGGLSFFDSAALNGTAITFSGSNQLAQVADGSSASFSMTIQGHTFTGSAVLPDKLSTVTYNQSSRVVTWSTTAAIHPAAYVTVRGSLTSTTGVVIAPFSDGTVTLPADFVSSGVGNQITVFATNVATDLAPAGTFEAPSYFRVSRADGSFDVDTFDWDLS